MMCLDRIGRMMRSPSPNFTPEYIGRQMPATRVSTVALMPEKSNAICRFCGGGLVEFIDLGMSPLCESFLTEDRLNSMEPFYPLTAYVCADCFLVQLQEYVAPERIFTEYAYFSGYSDAWLDHARQYVEMIVGRYRLGPQSTVVELGSQPSRNL